MPNLCETFEFLAIRTWWYLEAAAHPELRIGEETLTDINLIDIQYRHPAEVVTEKFSKQQEAQNGADWEWWLIFGGRTLGLRLQAKKLLGGMGSTEGPSEGEPPEGGPSEGGPPEGGRSEGGPPDGDSPEAEPLDGSPIRRPP